jgi:hypothetical protein
MRRVRILQEASAEVEEAVAWYERQRQGLGAEQARAVDAALDVLESPTVPLVAIPGHSGKRGLKRLVLRRFPFDIVVRESAEENRRPRVRASIAPSRLLAQPAMTDTRRSRAYAATPHRARLIHHRPHTPRRSRSRSA